MNKYIIVCEGKWYGTNADTLVEAEDKFTEKYPQFLDSIIRLASFEQVELF